MGDVKSNMTPKRDENKTAFGRVVGALKRKRVDDKAEPETFCDSLMKVQAQLDKLIVTKQAELSAEKGKEDYNRVQLARLNTMAHHAESIIILADEYANHN